MTEIAFEVEYTLTISGRGDFVFARPIDNTDWVLADGAWLGDCPIEPWTAIPRTIGPEGRPRFDLFAFQLRRAGDRERFTPGRRVMLKTGTQ